MGVIQWQSSSSDLILFLGTHSINLAQPSLRGRIVGRFGVVPWQAVYGVLSLVGFMLILARLWRCASARRRHLPSSRLAQARQSPADVARVSPALCGLPARPYPVRRQAPDVAGGQDLGLRPPAGQRRPCPICCSSAPSSPGPSPTASRSSVGSARRSRAPARVRSTTPSPSSADWGSICSSSSGCTERSWASRPSADPRCARIRVQPEPFDIARRAGRPLARRPKRRGARHLRWADARSQRGHRSVQDDAGALPGHDRKGARHDRRRGRDALGSGRASRIIHRVGALEPQDPIVFVGVVSRHRGDAFRACEFLIDYLKTRAPFWKKEHTQEGERWVEARASDDVSAERWERTSG